MSEDYKEIKEELLPYLEDYLKEQEYYKPDKEGCFHCRNPKHPDHNPSMSFKRGLTKVKCFSCGASYDIVNLAEIDKGLSYPQALDYLSRKYLNKPLRANSKPTATTAAAKPAYYDDMLAKLGDDKAIEYLASERKFRYAKEIAQAFKLKSDNELIYFPHYNVVEADGKKENKVTDWQARYFHPYIEKGNGELQRYTRSSAQVSLYDFPHIMSLPYGIEEGRKIVVAICEGEIDCLSFYDLKMEAKEELKDLYAVATSGAKLTAAFGKKLSAIKEENRNSYHFVLAMDDDETGKSASRSIETMIEALGFPYSSFCFLKKDKESGKCAFHDINDRLQNDRAGLLADLKTYLSDFSSIESQEKTSFEKKREDYLSHNTAKNHLNALLSDFSNRKANLSIDTGFKALNGLFYGVSQGVITLGALSSLGKTTLFLQIADQIAGQGKADVLYFSLEQSGKELVAKSLSRLTFLNAKRVGEDGLTKNAQFNYSIMLTKETEDGGYFKLCDDGKTRLYSRDETMLLSQSIKQYDQLSNRLFFITPKNSNSLTFDEIEETIKKHIELTGNKPIVFIDYLQIIASKDQHLTDKQAVDSNVSNLRRICSLYGLLVFAISSVGRNNYNSNIDMASFKESGAIEYGSDILLGLNFTALDEIEDKLTGKSKNEIESFIKTTNKAERSKKPRSVFLEVLKNRNGKTNGKAYFHYYQEFNTFVELEGKDGNEDIKSILKPIETANEAINAMEENLPF